MSGLPQVWAGSLGFWRVFEVVGSFLWGSQPAFLPSRPYFRVCVLVEVFLSTETSLYDRSARECEAKCGIGPWGEGGEGGNESPSLPHEDAPQDPPSHNSAGPVPLRINAGAYRTRAPEYSDPGMSGISGIARDVAQSAQQNCSN